ncbi:unnamed protein product [Protopolystoma xenopodis]|uniref:Uncharacterized protein n=1 Tax=Protopolystoma xenopodis TaxID=117903 RepID=A0A448WNT2_9PLAT|nr:unnamed protein product [Protopolystoma xenopodis]
MLLCFVHFVLYLNTYKPIPSISRLRILRKPKTYTGLTLPHKLPPLANPVDVRVLPLPGYLEQTVATILSSALAGVGQLKPKFPFVEPEKSALAYLALYLKGEFSVCLTALYVGM